MSMHWTKELRTESYALSCTSVFHPCTGLCYSQDTRCGPGLAAYKHEAGIAVITGQPARGDSEVDVRTSHQLDNQATTYSMFTALLRSRRKSSML